MTPEELDAAWAQRRTDNITTLAWIANAHLDASEFDDMEGGRIDDDYFNLFRASWCVHKIQLVQMIDKNPGIPDPLPPGTWPPMEAARNKIDDATLMAPWMEAPRKRCPDRLCTFAHGWVEDREMRWCPGPV